MRFVRSSTLVCVVRWFTLAMLIAGPIAATAPVQAQSSTCQAESEPNNSEGEAQPVASAFCIAGALPESGDQDLFIWTVDETDAKFWWNLNLTGIEGTVTTARIVAITSEPDVTPVVAGSELLQLSWTPGSTAPETTSFLVSAGRYLVGISRTDRADSQVVPDGSYEMDFVRGDRVPKRADKEPNDDATTATPLSGAFDISGDLQGSQDVFAWTFDEKQAASGWELRLTSPIDAPASLVIARADGTWLYSSSQSVSTY
ncbi:MAG TPA: hypothetical protein PK691_13335, partial [Thermomicrobiales bacterium]|nr:hypothetical protein [Thermomicrobiales bacterium]